MLIDTPKPQIDWNKVNGEREYYEPLAALLVQLQWTRLTAVLTLLLAVGLAGSLVRLWKTAEHQRIVILTPSDDGSFDHLTYVNAGSYHPGQKVIDYYALTFVRKYYSRIRYTISQDYPDSLEFLDPALKQVKLADAKQTQWIQVFQTSNDPEIRVVVTKVRHGESSGNTSRLSVDFEKHFYLDGREQTTNVENWTAELTYVLTPEDEISNDLIPVNPIGLFIGNITEAKGFRQ